MKQARLVVFTTTISLLAIAAIIFSSCTKDSCNGVVCQNGGTCTQGSCQCPSGYSGNLCEQSTIVYINNTYTPVSVTVNNTTHILSILGGYASYTGTAGTEAVVTAFTAATSASGERIGQQVNWSFTNYFPTGGKTLNVPINVPPTYFYLKMANADNSAGLVNSIQVNYGSDNAVSTEVSIPNNGTIYNIGYYQAFPNTEVYVVDSAGNHWMLSTAIIDSPNATFTLVVP